MSSTAPAKFTLRSLIVPVFIPSALFSTGEYALVPMIPASTERLGASIPLAGLIAGLVMIGTVFADIPAARVVNRLGERKAMMFSALLASVGIALAVMSQNIWLLSAGVLFVGGAVAVFALARHAYMAEYVPIDMRARALSVLGGMFRLGSFVGPMLSAAAIAIYGVSAALWLASGAMALSVVILIFARGDETQGVDAVGNDSTVKILWRERRKLLTVGTGSAILAMLRTTRIVGLPLWALSLHIPAQTTALYIGIAAALDFALFYTSGQIMDKYGRVWAAVPTLVGMGLTHLAVFMAGDATGFLWLALAMALANGLGSGLILVLGADLAPEDARSEFLGGYRVLVDGAVALSSPILSWAALLTGSVAVGMAGFGALGFVGAWLMFKYIPQYAPARSKVDQASPTS